MTKAPTPLAGTLLMSSMPVLNASLAAPARQKARMPGTQQEMWVFQTGSGDKLRIFGVEAFKGDRLGHKVTGQLDKFQKQRIF